MGRRGGWADDCLLVAPWGLQLRHIAQEEPPCWNAQKLEILTISNLPHPRIYELDKICQSFIARNNDIYFPLSA